MKRGDMYRVYKGNKYDSKDYRVYLVVSRQTLIDSKFPSVVCASVCTKSSDFSTQVDVDVEDRLKHDSSVYCDELVSIPKSLLTNFISHLSDSKMEEVNAALRVALAIE